MKPERSRVLTEGFLAGLIGYAVVVIFFALVNLLGDRSIFHTAALLGRGLTGLSAGASGVEAGPILAYNAIHLLAFLAIGLGAAWLVRATDRRIELWFVAFFVGVSGVVFVMTFFLLAVPTMRSLPWWSIAASNLAAAFGMGSFLLRRHPGLWRRVRDEGDVAA